MNYYQLPLIIQNRYCNQPFKTQFYYEFVWTRDAAGQINLVSIWA
jgi:hypothetical protein